jgi:AcrR family transcriptional regulator
MTSPGLRERKKQKTRWAIQEHALRLFAEQGYDATTVDQIAAAAEISPSTFFRYFKTKEDVVIEDQYDPILAEAFAAAPADLSPAAALRWAVRRAFGDVGAAEFAKIFERTRLTMSVPALRARTLENFTATLDLIATGVAARTGREPQDLEVRVFAGAVVGALITAIQLWVESEAEKDLAGLIDQALAHLDAGLPL